MRFIFTAQVEPWAGYGAIRGGSGLQLLLNYVANTRFSPCAKCIRAHHLPDGGSSSSRLSAYHPLELGKQQISATVGLTKYTRRAPRVRLGKYSHYENIS